MDDPKTPRAPMVWRIVLVVSLALNLAVAGVVIGAVSSGKAGLAAARTVDLGLGPVSRALEETEKRQIRRSLRGSGILQRAGNALRGGDFLAALTADPFDPDALMAVLEEQVSVGQEIQQIAQEAFVEVISQMSDERRAAFAAAVEEELSRRPPRPQAAE